MTESAKEESTIRVLVVDDNRDAADSLCVLVKLWGYDVHAVYDGEAVMDAAARFHPDCFFLDIGLPGVNGYTLARQIRQQPDLREAKLIALTAYSGDDVRRR